MTKIKVAEKIRSKKITKPGFMYALLGWVWKTFMYKKYNVNVIMNVDMKKVKEPHIFISNHASRLDYIYSGLAFYPQKLNFVAGYNEFFRSHLQGVFKLLRVSRLSVSFVSRSVSFNTIPIYFSCFSGGIVPSNMAFRYPFMEVNGERKSWDTFATNFFWSSSERAISLAR